MRQGREVSGAQRATRDRPLRPLRYHSVLCAEKAWPGQQVLVVCFVALAMQGLQPAAAQTSESSPTLLTKNLIAIEGGRHLNMVCIGEGSPAVVFEYGANGHILDWQKVQPQVSALTKACFYNRAGYGFSDPAARPMTAENVTDDLH